MLDVPVREVRQVNQPISIYVIVTLLHVHVRGRFHVNRRRSRRVVGHYPYVNWDIVRIAAVRDGYCARENDKFLRHPVLRCVLIEARTEGRISRVHIAKIFDYAHFVLWRIICFALRKPEARTGDSTNGSEMWITNIKLEG